MSPLQAWTQSLSYVEIDQLLEHADSIWYEAPDSVLLLCKEALHHAIETEHQKAEVLANRYLGSCYANLLSLPDTGIQYFSRASALYLSLGDTLQMMRMQGKIGHCYIDLGESDRAIAVFSENLELADQCGYPDQGALALANIGETYRYQKDEKNALKYLERAKDMTSTSDNERIKAGIEWNYALALDLNGRVQDAIDTYLAMSSYAVFDNEHDQGSLNHNLGRLYMRIGDYERSEQHLLLALNNETRMSVPGRKVTTLNEFCTLEYLRADYPSSTNYGSRAYKIITEIGQEHTLEDVTRNLAKSYEARGMADSALFFSKEHLAVYKRNYESESAKAQAELAAAIDIGAKEKEIHRLELEQAELETSRSLTNLGLIALALISALAGLALWSLRKKREQEKQLAMANIALKESQLRNKEGLISRLHELVREKNTIIGDTNAKLEAAGYNEQLRATKLRSLSEHVILTSEDWLSFKRIFDEVYPEYLHALKKQAPNLTKSEIRVVALMKLQLNNTEIGGLLGISADSVSKTKYRIKKKMDTAEFSSLDEFVMKVEAL